MKAGGKFKNSNFKEMECPKKLVEVSYDNKLY